MTEAISSTDRWPASRNGVTWSVSVPCTCCCTRRRVWESASVATVGAPMEGSEL